MGSVASQSAAEADRSFAEALRDRPEVQLVVAYLGGAWLCYEVAGLVVFVLDLPDVALRWFIALLGVGAVVALLFGRWLRLTILDLRGGRTGSDEDIAGVPDFLEPFLIRITGTVSKRTTLLTTSASTILFLLLFFFLWRSWAFAHERQIPDSRVAVLVTPFAEAGAGVQGMGAGFGDLLSTTLDGTPGLRIIDPSSVRDDLPLDGGGAFVTPGVDEIRAWGARVGAEHVVTGSLLSSGSRLEISARIHDVGGVSESRSLQVSAHEDSLASAVDRLAIDIVASVWSREQVPAVPDIDRSATSDPEALKAYLEAKDASWRGRMDEAQEAVERAVALDSTFALAHLEQAIIESWQLWARGEPMTGLRPIFDRAARHADRLTPRNRMRVDARRALDDTDAQTAAFLFQRILAIDSLDLDALQGLAYTYLSGGWQLGAGADEVIDAYRRVARADSTSQRALYGVGRLELWRGNREGAEDWLARLAQMDSLRPGPSGLLGFDRVLSAPDEAVDSLLASLAQSETPVVTGLIRDLRITRPDLARRFHAQLRADSMPAFHQRLGLGGDAQILMAMGRFSTVDSLLDSGAADDLRAPLTVYRISAALVGVGDSASAAPFAAELAAQTPVDSLEVRLETSDAWVDGWAVGAFHATFGDTTEARRWQEGLAQLPPGETTVPDWPSSLSADIEARIAARRGDLDAAEASAQRAFDLWVIHSDNVLEYQPEPAMRFHLAQLRQARGSPGSAESLYRSLCPPFTWMGFLTARASLELGRILEERGELEEAAARYRAAEELWRYGDPGVVGSPLVEAREGVARTAG